MSEMLEIPELAIDRTGRRFPIHRDAVFFKVEKLTSGRPYVVRVRGEVLLVAVQSTFQEFEEKIGYKPGLYRLRQVDAQGNELDAPTAFAEIQGENFGASAHGQDLESAFALCHRMAQANEHKDSIMAEVTKTLLHTHVQLQTGAARMIEAATTTIRVANGIEAIERGQTVIDVDLICDRVIDAMDEREPPPRSAPPWWVQMLAGPVGVRLLTILENALPQQPKTENK